MNRNLRIYTRKNLNNGLIYSLLKNLSLTYILILINVIFFVLIKIFMIFNPGFLTYIALRPTDFVQGRYLWTVLTSMFMHANLFHLFFNMFSLYFIGKFVERIIGKKRFFIFYIISGIFAGLLFALLSGFFGGEFFWGRILGNPNMAGVGASGAIFGLLGILAFITPKARVYLILGPLIALVLQAIMDSLKVSSIILGVFSFLFSVYFIISLFAILSFNPRWLKIAIPINIPFWMIPIMAILPLVVVGYFVDLPIGNMAHFGGFVAGAVYGFYLLSKYPKKIKLLNQYVKQ